jgi:hypothetical protein
MATGKLVQLLTALKLGTEKGRVQWQDLSDEDMFRAHVGGGMVRIGRTEAPDRRGYKLWLLGYAGSIAGELEIYPGEPHYELIQDVYSSARLAARGGDRLVDSIIRILAPEGVGP